MSDNIVSSSCVNGVRLLRDVDTGQVFTQAPASRKAAGPIEMCTSELRHAACSGHAKV